MLAPFAISIRLCRIPYHIIANNFGPHLLALELLGGGIVLGAAVGHDAGLGWTAPHDYIY